MTVLRTGKNALCAEGMCFGGGGDPVSERNGVVSGKYDQNIDYPNRSRHVRIFLFLKSQAQVRLPESVSKVPKLLPFVVSLFWFLVC
ncbi:hypothetical protein CEXT_179991 [Caerostris extrusa]|uniref:Uncharacterized protein n=1 Tax=Caerostris extrusa TaxID=172846 RepID=A0AAV4QFC9_CAEEX|nr:hypothetical protein CEXT_179991 [Caerostris extrusa]